MEIVTPLQSEQIIPLFHRVKAIQKHMHAHFGELAKTAKQGFCPSL